MCVGFWTLEHPDYALIFGSNRDEFLSRPTQPAQFHSSFGAPHDDHGNDAGGGPILSGIDIQAGGTWLGISRTGKFAIVTNITEEVKQRFASSRGHLVSTFLRSPLPSSVHRGNDGGAGIVGHHSHSNDESPDVDSTIIPLHEELADLDAFRRDARYAGFNLLLLSPRWEKQQQQETLAPAPSLTSASLRFEACFVTNHGQGGDIAKRGLTAAERACGGISNGIDGRGAENWPKIQQGLRAMQELLDDLTNTKNASASDDATTCRHPDTSELELAERLFKLLTTHPPLTRPIIWRSVTAPRERAELRNTIEIDPLCIPLGGAKGYNTYYATRIAQVVLVRRDGSVLYIERDIWKLLPQPEEATTSKEDKEMDMKPVRMPASEQRLYRFRICKGEEEGEGKGKGKEEREL